MKITSPSIILLLILTIAGCSHSTDWRTADRSSTGIAPKASEYKPAVVQVYAARAFNWRQYFAVHTWVAFKERDKNTWQVLQVVGWRTRRGLPAVVETTELPDRRWYGNDPEIVMDIRGDRAEKAIASLRQAKKSYPHPNTYTVFPGPNSNTFVSYLVRNTPELKGELPPHAIGKDWLVNSAFLSKNESGTGFQISIYGLLGLNLGLAEGIEFNILGMIFGLDVLRPAIKLPFIGRLGFSDKVMD
ncbi:MAG: DUF3750 domain-containing protein [Bdellovibrionales bacterium]